MNGCKPECLRTKQAWDRCFRWPYHRSSLCSAVFCCELVSMQNKFWVVLVLLYLVWKSQVVKNIRKAEKSRIIFTDFFKLFESRSANSLNCENLDDLFKLKWVHRVTESWSSLDWKGPLWGFYYFFFFCFREKSQLKIAFNSTCVFPQYWFTYLWAFTSVSWDASPGGL